MEINKKQESKFYLVLPLLPLMMLTINIAAEDLSARATSKVNANGNAIANPSAILKNPAITETAESAVMRALRWLSLQQNPDGAWSDSAASTALAMTAFFAHNENPDIRLNPEFGATVLRGAKALLETSGTPHSEAKTASAETDDSLHLLASALLEGYDVTMSPVLLEAGFMTAKRLIKSQNLDGGWTRDAQSSASDNAIYSAWCVNALALARNNAQDRDESPLIDLALSRAHSFFNNDEQTSQHLPGVSAFALCFAGGSWSSGAEYKRSLTNLSGAQCSFKEWETQPWGKEQHPVQHCFFITRILSEIGGSQWVEWRNSFAPELIMRQQIVEGAYTNSADGKVHAIGWWDSPNTNEFAEIQSPEERRIRATALCAMQITSWRRRRLPTFSAPETKPPQNDSADSIQIQVKWETGREE